VQVLREYYATAKHESFSIIVLRDLHACWSEYRNVSFNHEKCRTQSHLLPPNTDDDYLIRVINEALKDALNAIEHLDGPVIAVTMTSRTT
jgi:hypothetical protein